MDGFMSGKAELGLMDFNPLLTDGKASTLEFDPDVSYLPQKPRGSEDTTRTQAQVGT